MAFHFSGASAARLTLAIVVLSARGFADEDNCQLVDYSGVEEKEQCLLQRSRPEVRPHIIELKGRSRVHTSKSDGLSWTTNIGQENHKCEGSRFDVDFSGTHSGMVVTSGILLKKAKCHSEQLSTRPLVTQGLSCEANATGCHMWCAPVWHSHHDMSDWSLFDYRCSNWDGSFNSDDAACAKTGQVFTWARADTQSSKNQLALTFAVTQDCGNWCSPLWVTIYDPKNWAKTYRWCFNRKDDWGVCDVSEDVSLNAWHDWKFAFNDFLQKHGYTPEHFVLELAVYAEFESAEVLINSLKLSHVKEETTTAAPPPPVQKTCGAQQACGNDHHCCRLGDSEVDAKCCPKSWSCCEDSCCPAYYNCTITDAGHTCKPPVEEAPERPELCNL